MENKSIRVAINGLGRIGKLVLQYVLEEGDSLVVVAVNDLTDTYQLYCLLMLDSTQQAAGKTHAISYKEHSITIDGKEIPVYAEPDPSKLPWKELGVDVVCECTGRFATPELAHKHIEAGAKHVLVNSPVKGVKNIVYGVNSDSLDGTEETVCGASCTTNCLAPLAKALDESFGIVQGMMVTAHAYTADQSVLDSPHRKGADSRRGRCAAMNIVPTTTGAAEAVAKALPQLKGKLTGMALRVPVATGSVVVFDVLLDKPNLTKEAINGAIVGAADETLGATNLPIVSRDVVGESHGSLVDLQSTKVLESDGKTTFAQIVSWYDNEASYTHQYVKTLIHWADMLVR